MPYKVTDICMLCGACVVGCESNAITEGETRAHIDVNICVECGTCERNCPSEAIIFVEEESEPGAAQPSKDVNEVISS
ncbi:MAG: 4Fe-4S dicluster domain-containing protein [Chloroflexota bacterium]